MFCLSGKPPKHNSKNISSDFGTFKKTWKMEGEKACTPDATEIEKAMEFSGLLLTNKNVAEDEDFDIEITEVFNVGYLPLHSLIALPVCWAAARLRPVKDMPLNTELFDDESDVLDIAAVLAFPKAAQKLQTPVTLNVQRCGRITLPPRKPGSTPEDALLIYSYEPREEDNKYKKDIISNDNRDDS